MKTKYLYKFVSMTLVLLLGFSCTDDLNTEPEVQQRLEDLLAEDPNAAKGLLARLYANLVVHGTGVPGSDDQQADIVADDPGSTVYLRSLWNLQELTTDIAKNRWGDGGLDPLTTTAGWTSTNKFFRYMYERVYFQVSQSNNFLRESQSIDFDEREIMRAEARFLRALAYYHGMDLFGGIPIITEDDGVIVAPKARATRTEVFNFVEKELNEIMDVIPATNEYGRVTKGAVNMLLAKIYLNAEIYTGTAAYDKALTATETVINDGNYSLDNDYQSIFQGDNFTSPEIIFPLIGDRTNVQSFGSTTYIVNGSYSGETMNVTDGDNNILYDLSNLGAQEGWGGHRCTQALYSLFGDLNPNSFDTSIDETDGNRDQRAIFFTNGHEYEMSDYRNWKEGYPTTKFRNTYADDANSPTMSFSDIDFPLFRLGDAYLMYAEAHLRGGGGSLTTAVDYINQLRARAYGNTSGNISEGDLNLDFIIDERARELYYEGHRRQDLIRFDRFTGGSYNWPWKGGVPNGTSISSDYKLFPLPLSVIQVNPLINENNPGF